MGIRRESSRGLPVLSSQVLTLAWKLGSASASIITLIPRCGALGHHNPELTDPGDCDCYYYEVKVRRDLS